MYIISDIAFGSNSMLFMSSKCTCRLLIMTIIIARYYMKQPAAYLETQNVPNISFQRFNWHKGSLWLICVTSLIRSPHTLYHIRSTFVQQNDTPSHSSTRHSLRYELDGAVQLHSPHSIPHYRLFVKDIVYQTKILFLIKVENR